MKMRVNFIFGFVYFLFSLLQSCECVVPVCNEDVGFSLIDKISKKDLIFGSNPTYFKDSMSIKSNFAPYYSPVSLFDSTSLFLPFADTIYLRLNSFEVDTAIVHYSVSKKTYCCHTGFASPTYMVFNGKRTNIQGNKFLIEK